PGLDVLFVGINPGLYTAAIGHHFGRPGNRFWSALHHAGFTPRVLSPFQERELLGLGLGVTNLVNRATASAAALDDDAIRAGPRSLAATIARISRSRSAPIVVRARTRLASPPIWISARGWAWRFRYQLGCRSSPAFDATTTGSPSSST